MKKLLVLALAVVLVLSLTVVASASTFDPYVGGRITWVYEDSDAREDEPIQYGASGIKMLLKGKVSDEDTGTWGAIGAKIDGWPDNDKGLGTSSIYEFGVDGIGGSNFNIWYSNFENEKGNRGQSRIYNIDPLQTHEDCMFDRDLSDNVIGIDYVTDNLIINFGYALNKKITPVKTMKPEVQAEYDDYDLDGDGKLDWYETAAQRAFENSLTDDEYDISRSVADDNEMSIAFTYLLDGGDVHAGYYVSPENWNETNVGGSFKLGFGTIKADYLKKSPDKGDSGSVIQAGVSFDALNLGVTVAMDDQYWFEKEGGLIYEIKYSPIDNVTLCYRAADADKNIKEDLENNFTNFYVGYKYGVIETRVGMATKKEDNKALGLEKEDIVYASCYVSFW